MLAVEVELAIWSPPPPPPSPPPPIPCPPKSNPLLCLEPNPNPNRFFCSTFSSSSFCCGVLRSNGAVLSTLPPTGASSALVAMEYPPRLTGSGGASSSLLPASLIVCTLALLFRCDLDLIRVFFTPFSRSSTIGDAPCAVAVTVAEGCTTTFCPRCACNFCELIGRKKVVFASGTCVEDDSGREERERAPPPPPPHPPPPPKAAKPRREVRAPVPAAPD